MKESHIRYEEFRPTLALPQTDAQAQTRATQAGFGSTTVLSVGTNSNGSEYALHPAMGALHQVYQAGKLAIINGVHYPFADHSHFRSMAIWYAADPLGPASLGWFGKYLNVAGFQATEVPGVLVGGGLNPLFTPTQTSLFAFRDLSDLRFPAAGELEQKQATFRALHAQSATGSAALFPELVRIGQTGVAGIDHIQDYYKFGVGLDNAGKVEALLLNADQSYEGDNPLIYPSPLNSAVDPDGNELGLARDLRHVAATIRADVGARFFHVGVGGYDTHSNQEDGFWHSYLLQEVSEALAAFYGEINQAVSLPGGYTGYLTGNLANKVVVVVFSEFGRTIRQNATNPTVAGTDHATSAPVLILGGTVLGGQHGAYPLLDDPGENDDDLKMTYDFRDVFGTVLTRWLNVPGADVGPGVGKILPATPEVDGLGRSYTAFNPIGFLTP